MGDPIICIVEGLTNQAKQRRGAHKEEPVSDAKILATFLLAV